MIRIGFAGVENFGLPYLEQIPQQEDISVSAFISNAKENTLDSSNIHLLNSVEDCIQENDAILIHADKASQFHIATQAIRAGKHILLCNPILLSVEESAELMKMSKEANVKCMIGGTERFNTAWVAIQDKLPNPMFIEGHRLAIFNTDESSNNVILDLMIQDIDLVLSIVRSEIKRISASGMAVLSPNIDIANARLEFSNGCIVNLTASRVSIKEMSKLRIFQKDGYHSIDFLERSVDYVSIQEKTDNQLIQSKTNKSKLIDIRSTKHEDTNNERHEILSFIQCIKDNSNPLVSIQDSYLALDIAHKILRKIHNHGDK